MPRSPDARGRTIRGTTRRPAYGLLVAGVSRAKRRWPREGRSDAPGKDAIVEFVAAARAATGNEIARYDAFAFGDSPAMADELAALVLHGPKRATAGLYAEYEAEGEPLPVASAYGAVLDGAGGSVCLIRTREVTVKPLGAVDAVFARDEDEADRSLAYLWQPYDDFFARSGFPVTDASLVVLERFDLIYPLAVSH